jgi:hypothetical protein
MIAARRLTTTPEEERVKDVYVPGSSPSSRTDPTRALVGQVPHPHQLAVRGPIPAATAGAAG